MCPGFGAAVMFDEGGKSMVLTTEASTPAEYVTPVADWLKSRSKGGRHVAAVCHSCGTRTFRSADSPALSADAARCFVCRGEAEIAAMSGLHRSFERHRLLWAVVFSVPWLISTAVGKMTKGVTSASVQYPHGRGGSHRGVQGGRGDP